jgi:acetyl-CoA carboxylase carboxyltransferase component
VWSFVDDLIDPADTRASIIRGREIGETKQVERPWRKRGVLPV